MGGPVSLRFDGWIPFRLFWQGGQPGVEWLYLGNRRLTEPFFEAAVQTAVQTPFNSLFRFRTPAQALEDWHSTSPGLKPSGFIFHLSRCGSTLITQMLAALDGSVVLSEPGVLDRTIRSHLRAPQATETQRIDWLRWLVSALGQPRTGEERHLFIKFEPRHILDFDRIRSAFPDVPWVFVYREPVEVLVSNLQKPSALVTRGMYGLDAVTADPELAGVDDDEYAARMLGIVAEAAVVCASQSPGGMLVEYRELPDAVWRRLPAHFGLAFTDADIDRMKSAAVFDAKQPSRRFEADTETKQRHASERIRTLADRWIRPAYRTLEKLRS